MNRYFNWRYWQTVFSESLIEGFPKYIFLTLRLSLLMLFYSLFRGLFYIYNADQFPDINPGGLLTIFIGGFRFDLAGLLYLNIIYFIFVLLPFYFTYKPLYQKSGNIIFILINIIGFFANSIDVVYYPFTLKRTTGSVFAEFKNEEGLFSVFLHGFIDYWHVTLFFILLSLFFIWIVKKIKIKKSGLSTKYFYIFHSVFLVVVIFFMINGIRSGFGRSSRPISIGDAGQYVDKPSQISIVLNTPFSIIRTLSQKKFSEIKDFKSTEELERVFTPLKSTQPKIKENHKNVIILVLESFSKEHSARLNPHRLGENYEGFIPFIDSLMGQSLYYTNAFASGRKSIDALPSIVAGIPYLGTHFVISNYSTNKVQGLGHILLNRGYHLSFFHGAPNGSMGFNSIMKMFGFENYFGKDEFNNDEYYETWGIYDEEFLQYFVMELNKMPQPFASVFFSLSSHHPWDVPERYGDKFDDGPKPMFRTVRYVDWAVKNFFKTASQMPWYKNTIFVITADHAAYIYHDAYKNDIGDFSIPLFFFTPDSSLQGKDTRVASQLDIFPTILDYLGIQTPYFSFGSSLLDSTMEKQAFYYSRGSYFILQDSLVLQMRKNKVVGLYNYFRDWEMNNNLAEMIPEEKNYLEKKMRAIRQQYTNRMIKNQLVPDN